MRNRLIPGGLGLFVCILVACYAIPAGAQNNIQKYQEDCAQVDPHSGPRSEAGYQEMAISLNHPKEGDSGLSSKDLRLYEGTKGIPIQFFRQEPVSVGIVVDTSMSMGAKIPQARSALEEFIQNLNPADELFLFAFSDAVFLLQPLTSRHQAVIQRLSLLHAYGRTALYDAIIDGLTMVSLGCYRTKALLVITDGMDTASTSSLDKVLAQAREHQVPIYSIGIGNPNVPPASGVALVLGPLAPGAIAEMDRVDVQILQRLAKDSGANTFIMREVGDGALLRKAVNLVNDRLGNNYTVGFVRPPKQPLAGLHLEVATGMNITAQLVGGGSVQVTSASAGR